MILAFDTYYFASKAKTVCIAFDGWQQEAGYSVHEETIHHDIAYQPGEFFKRELPCILSLFRKLQFDYIEAIIVDGFVVLDDQLKSGLGMHLYESIGKAIPIIGVAKSNFAGLAINQRPILRGQSISPLFITAAGIDLDTAAAHIKAMGGAYRIPTLLKTLDTLTKQQ